MKQKFLLAAGVAAVLFFSSCKKDKPGTPDPTPPPAAKLLKKVTKTEAGVTTVYTLTYDAAKRLTSYKNTDNSESIVFTYDGAGNLTGIDQKDHEFKNKYVYTYANNVPVSGTFKSWQVEAGQPDQLIEDDKLTYTVTNNRVSKIKLEMEDVTMNLLMTYTNGNLTNVTTEGAALYTANFTFGNKKAVYPKVTPWVLDQAGFSMQFASNNELLSVVYDFPGTENDTNLSVTHTYDSNGYVLTSDEGAEHTVYEYE